MTPNVKSSKVNMLGPSSNNASQNNSNVKKNSN